MGQTSIVKQTIGISGAGPLSTTRTPAAFSAVKSEASSRSDNTSRDYEIVKDRADKEQSLWPTKMRQVWDVERCK